VNILSPPRAHGCTQNYAEKAQRLTETEEEAHLFLSL
jgi:hypothetical protein